MESGIYTGVVSMFLRWGGYAVEKGYSPSPIGTPKIELWAERERRGGMDITIKHATAKIGF